MIQYNVIGLSIGFEICRRVSAVFGGKVNCFVITMFDLDRAICTDSYFYLEDPLMLLRVGRSGGCGGGQLGGVTGGSTALHCAALPGTTHRGHSHQLY